MLLYPRAEQVFIEISTFTIIIIVVIIVVVQLLSYTMLQFLNWDNKVILSYLIIVVVIIIIIILIVVIIIIVVVVIVLAIIKNAWLRIVLAHTHQISMLVWQK